MNLNFKYIALLSMALLGFNNSTKAQFTAGNLVVLQAGDGSVPLTNTGNAIILKEFTPTGNPGFSLPISTSVNPLLISGSATSEGGLTLSPNGKFLVFSGYAQTLPNSTALAGSASSVISRGIGIVNAAGSYSRIATSNTFYSTNNIRSAASDGNNNYWASGANDGTDYFGIVSTATNVQNANTNTRGIGIFSNNLYFSTGSGTLIGVYQVGTGLPVTSAQTNMNVISTMSTGVGTPSPYSFFFNAAQTVCYIADDRTIANGGGIQKWVFSSSTWSLAYTLNTASTFGARGVVADFSGPNPIVYATTTESTANRLIAISDIGSSSTATTLATSQANTLFRSVAFSPFCSGSPVINSATSNNPCAGATLNFTVTASATVTPTYSWTGPNTFTSNAQNPSITNVSSAANGTYSVTLTDGCGSTTSTVAVSINTVPVISVNASTVCAGGSATLIASGANTYTWNTSSNSATIVVSPISSTNYTVDATSLQGCVNTATTSVVITGAPAISVNSATICSGNSATLNASGVSTYTWSTGSNASSITPSPSTTTTYTVSGMASGCAVTASNTATIVVNATPTVVLSALASPVCVNNPTMALTGTPSGGIYSGPGVIGNTFNPSTAGAGTFTISYSYTTTSNCSSADSKTISVNLCTGINKISQTGIFNVYPNPVQNELSIHIENSSLPCSISIFGVDGKLLYSENTTESLIKIDAANYKSGLYLIRISTSDKQSVIKFIKD